jgi:O-antigen ligase
MSGTPAVYRRDGLILNLAAGVVITLLVLVVLAGGEQLLLLAAGALLACVALPFLPWLAVPLFGLLLGACFLMNDITVPIVVRWYGADLVLAFVALACVRFVYQYSDRHCWNARPRSERYLVLLLVAGALYALLPLGAGLLVAHNAMTDVMGDVRRFYVYPLAMLVPLFVPIPAWQRDRLHAAFVAACFLLLLMGAYRLASGARWAEDIYSLSTSEIVQPRILSHTEAMNLTAVAAFLTATVRTARYPVNRLAALVLLAASAGLLVICGWRLAVIYAAAAPVAVLFMLRWLRKEPFWRIALTLTATATAALAALFTLAALFPGDMGRIFSKLLYRFQNVGSEPDSRYFSWRHAIDEWQEAPIFGKGLGHQLYYYFRASDGQFLAEFGSTHNLLLDLLYQTGLVGVGLFLAVQGMFIFTVWRRLPTLRPQYHAVAAGLVAAYIAIWGFALLQPLQVGAFVTLFMCMGFLLLLFRVSITDENT